MKNKFSSELRRIGVGDPLGIIFFLELRMFCTGKFVIKSAVFRVLNFATKSVRMPSAVVVLPPGAEEIEFVGSVDVLRRAGVNCFSLKSLKFIYNFQSITLADYRDCRRIGWC